MKRFRPSGETGGPISGAFVFALLSAFAILSILIVLLGARVFRTVEDNAAMNQQTRTPLMYLANKVRSHDTGALVEVFDGPEGSVVSLGALYAGEQYNTYIFYSQGKLMEYFGKADAGFRPEFGEAMLDVSGFSAVLEGDLMALSVVSPDGVEHTLHLLLQGAGEGAGQ